MACPQLCPCFWPKTRHTVGAQSLWDAGTKWASSALCKSLMIKFSGRPGRCKLGWPRCSGRISGRQGRCLGGQRRGGQMQVWEGLGSVKRILQHNESP